MILEALKELNTQALGEAQCNVINTGFQSSEGATSSSVLFYIAPSELGLIFSSFQWAAPNVDIFRPFWAYNYQILILMNKLKKGILSIA